MKNFQETHLKLSHQDKELEAVFVHQPMDDEKQNKKYKNFIEEMHMILQKFMEKSDCFNAGNKQNNHVKCKEDEKEMKENLGNISPQKDEE